MSNDEHYYRAVHYQLLADYYKFTDPEKHIHFYNLHYSHFQSWLRKDQYSQGLRTPSDFIAKIRTLHASPDTTPLDIYVNNEPIWRDIRYTNSSAYWDTHLAEIQISIYSAGTTSSPLLSGTVQLENDSTYTIAIGGNKGNLQLFVIEDDPSVPQSEAKMRFWHLSPNSPTVDIGVKKGDVVFSDISYSELSEYLGLTPMTLDLEVRVAGTKDVVLPLNRVSLKPDLAYTLVAVGNINEKPDLEVLFLVP